MNAQEVVAAAMSLSEEERAQVLRRLLDAVDPGDDLTDEDWAAEWGPELDARVDEAIANPTTLVDGEVVLAELRRKYGRTK